MAKKPFTQDEIVLCIYAARHEISEIGGIDAIAELQSRSHSSIRMKIQNIVAMCDEEGIRRNPKLHALTGLSSGETGRRTNWEILKQFVNVSEEQHRFACERILGKSNTTVNHRSTKMRISTFFEKTLGANLANARWSWGATNPSTNQIFLRIWANDLETIGGNECVSILWTKWEGTSAGYAERERHIDALRNGAEGFGVLCREKPASKPRHREIASFNDKHLLKFGGLIEEEGRVYAKVIDRVPVEELARPRTNYSSVIPDLKAILSKRSDKTAKEVLINARLGQGAFRTQVLKMWNSVCCVTGSRILDAIRASHIKPWRDSSNEERLDPNNGLPLVATLDALFDSGLITFSADTELIVSKRLSPKEKQILGLAGLQLLKQPNAHTSEYLAYHRKNVFLDDI